MPYAFILQDDEKRELLRIARTSLKEYLLSGRVPPGAPHRKCMTEPAGCFVTLHRDHKLRGCIGKLDETAPLYKAIQEMAVAAASRDPRYQPVSVEELTLLTIEVAVLGPRRQIKGPDEVEIGTHGVCVSSGARRGLLLPHAAVENGWDAATFLGKACERAGLPVDTWRGPTATLEVFSAQVFDEITHKPPGK
jgi:uncharacterized protein